MHEKLQELIDFTREKFHLNEFHLKRHSFFKETNPRNEVAYILNMEWFPNSTLDETDDFNPAGTVSIDIDFHTRQVKSLIFVEGVNELEASLPTSDQVEAAIEWVEEETGLEFGRQFKLVNTEGPDLTFLAAADNIPIFPSGYIELEFNEAGKLSLYSIHGNFPEADKITWEPFALTEEQTKEIIREQLTRLEIPIVDEECWQPVYAISSCFITNKGKNVLSYEQVEADPTYIPIGTVLEWEQAEARDFPSKEIDQSTETTLETVLEKQEQALQPLTENEQQKAVEMTTAYLQSLRPDDSGKWKLASLRLEDDYVFAVLRLAEDEARVLTRKLTIVLESDTLDPVNHIDNQSLLDTFKDYKQAAPAKFTAEEAFDILYKYIEVTPVYVYNQATEEYILCGKIDSELAVDAVTGEVVEMESLM